MFHKENFKKIVVKIPFFTNMLVEEKNCTSTSLNGLIHSDLFNDKLNQTIRYARVVFPSKYDEAVEKYVILKMTVTRRAARQNHDAYDNNNSDNSAPQKKCGKKRTSIPVIWTGTTVSSSSQKSTRMIKVPYNESNDMTCTLFLQN